MAETSVSHARGSSLSLASIALKVAIATAPLTTGVFFADAHAAITKTFTGFTGVFAPSNWTPLGKSDGSGSLNATTMVLEATDSTPPGSFQYSFDTNLLNAALPSGAAKFIKGEYSFTWDWSFMNGPATKPPLGVIYPLVTFDGVDVSDPYWAFSGGNLSDPNDYITAGTVTADASEGNAFGFRLASTLSGDIFQDSIATITNFEFVATYEEVPGPLPIAGAAAGFAWSRRMRRRLKASAASSVNA